ncbi:MAG: DinB family protein [Bacteroidota bacterium]
MTFNLQQSIDILSRTPAVLDTLLRGLPDAWLNSNEGEDTWSPHDILGHLIHGEKTDWMVRAKLILSQASDKTFEPFDRFAQMQEGPKKSLEELLNEFNSIRLQNLAELGRLPITETALAKKGVHPDLGVVTLKELLATWVVHDLGHISQIVRVMGKHYKSEVGPWQAYLGILKQ